MVDNAESIITRGTKVQYGQMSLYKQNSRKIVAKFDDPAGTPFFNELGPVDRKKHKLIKAANKVRKKSSSKKEMIKQRRQDVQKDILADKRRIQYDSNDDFDINNFIDDYLGDLDDDFKFHG
eukprot:2396711-Ditylum_brightwellii.AAC.1